MNSKSTHRPGGKGAGRPETRTGGKAGPAAGAFRPDKKAAAAPKTPAGDGYGVYRDAAPAAVKPPLGRSPAPPALAEALRVVAAEVKALKNEVAQKDTEIKALQKRLTLLEARQKAQEKAYRTAQYPAQATALPLVRGPRAGAETTDMEETTEERLAEEG